MFQFRPGILSRAAVDGAAGVAAPSPPLDGLTGLTGAWSVSRKLLTAYGGAFYAVTAGEITSVLHQNGGTALIAFDDEPQLGTAGSNNRACATFNGTNESLRYTPAISTLINNNAGYIIASVIIDSIGTAAPNAYNNDCIFSDLGQYIGYHLASTPVGHAFNWDGSEDKTTNTSFPVGSAAVVEWRHDGGNLMSRVNKGTWQSVASGNTSALTNPLHIFHNAAKYSHGKLFEMATLNVVPSDVERDAVAQNFMDWIGA